MSNDKRHDKTKPDLLLVYFGNLNKTLERLIELDIN